MHYNLCDYLLDGVQNAVEAGALQIEAGIHQEKGVWKIYITDNGKGMDEKELSRAMDPFYTDGEKHQSRKVGLGLPFFKQAAEAARGRFEIFSQKGQGTQLTALFQSDHMDCPPLGDVAGTVLSLMLFPGTYEFFFSRKTADAEYTVSRKDLLDNLGDLETSDSILLARKYLRSLEEDLTYTGGNHA